MSSDPADPVTAALSALAAHKKDCHACRAFTTRPGAPWCSQRIELTAAWREALRGAGVQATTTPPSR